MLTAAHLSADNNTQKNTLIPVAVVNLHGKNCLIKLEWNKIGMMYVQFVQQCTGWHGNRITLLYAMSLVLSLSVLTKASY